MSIQRNSWKNAFKTQIILYHTGIFHMLHYFMCYANKQATNATNDHHRDDRCRSFTVIMARHFLLYLIFNFVLFYFFFFHFVR